MASPTTLGAIRIRAIEPDDQAALKCFYSGLSATSLSRRFFGASRGIGDRAAVFFCGPDHDHREGLVAVVDDPASLEPTIVAHICLEPSGMNEVEMAVAVADAWQRHGIGRRLLMDAMAWADQHGIERLRASMLSTNVAIVGLLRSIGRPVALTMANGGVVDVTIDLSPALRSAA